MTTFFVKFRVAPVPGSEQAELVEGAYAFCWVVEDSAVAASNMARFYVTKGDWEIRDDSEQAIEVIEEACQEWDIAREGFRKAQDQGIALVYSGWSLDGKTTAGPTSLPETTRFDLPSYIGKQKKLANKGRCLHFDSDGRCAATIKAHSIQKGGQLSVIAEDGHVYAGWAINGQIALERCGIGKMSAFAGFCNAHDSKLFAPIDTQALIPTDEQVALYAYRSLCREFFVKENALALIESQLANWPEDHPFTFPADLKTGTICGLENIRRHKADFDASLKTGSFRDFQYVLFTARQKPTVAFSGLIYPHFDFLGRQLQALEDQSASLDLLTFCSAPMPEGWGFLFAWHKTSASTCTEFMRSLATAMHDGDRGADALFRLVVSNCENAAFAPSWWEKLDEGKKAAVSERINFMTSTFRPVEPDYLTKGLERISGWDFERVLTNVPDEADKPESEVQNPGT